MRHSRIRILCRLSVVVALIAGCESAPAVPPGVLDVTGIWEGDWNGGLIGMGHIVMELQQRDTRVIGKLSITNERSLSSGMDAISATDGPVEGRVVGSTFRFRQPDGVIAAELAVTGDVMAGSTTGKIPLDLSLQRQAPSR
jgi:hypothetical protein